MTDFLRLVVEVLTYLWPFRTVHAWERGVYYVLGRTWRTVGPGVWPICPYFMDVLAVSTAPSIHSTPLQIITLRGVDGKGGATLSFSATATIRVENAELAINGVENWPETTVELISGQLSEKLADADPARFDPARNKRDRLLEELRLDLDEITKTWGVRVLKLRFNNFAIGLRTYRLLSEQATLREIYNRAPHAVGQPG